MVQAPETKCSQTDSIYFIPIAVDILNEFIHPGSDFRVVRGRYSPTVTSCGLYSPAE